jgi:hypothetical protein
MRRKQVLVWLRQFLMTSLGVLDGGTKKRFPFVCPSVWAEVHNELLLTFRVRTLAVTMKQDQVDRAHTHTLSRSADNLPAGQNQTLGIVYFFIYCIRRRVFYRTHTRLCCS